jgi:hypothetical protein
MTRREPPSAAELHRRYRSVRPKLEEYLGNMPSSEGGGGKGGHSDRTATIALAPDAARLDLQWLDLHVGRLTGTSSITARIRIDDTLRRWELTEAQADGLRGDTQGKGEPGCRSCARIHDTLGRPLWSPRHPGLEVCQRCHRTLKRQRIHDGYRDSDLVAVTVLRWMQRHADSKLTDETLHRLLRG